MTQQHYVLAQDGLDVDETPRYMQGNRPPDEFQVIHIPPEYRHLFGRKTYEPEWTAGGAATGVVSAVAIVILMAAVLGFSTGIGDRVVTMLPMELRGVAVIVGGLVLAMAGAWLLVASLRAGDKGHTERTRYG